ncbi:type I restriction endonuclease subunit R [Rosistilla oblonga]|uniref:type I restriction endonuclease subunit R n=1 Tax=Rosistilla oblonga TaxID=2527990 RepID=UPI003A983B0E
MPETNSDASKVQEKGPSYKKVAGGVSDTSEGGLEKIIFDDMVDRGWRPGVPKDYDREYCVDLAKLREFLTETQPKIAEELLLESDNPTRRKFLARLEKEIVSRGVIDVIRRGIKFDHHDIELFYGTPSPGNAKSAELFAGNRFSITRQLQYSLDESGRALDLGIFINGLPIATFELKNNLTNQDVDDAVSQYSDERQRNPKERLFAFGRCIVHFAVDDSQVKMCTHLNGKKSWFLPFNQGWNDGAGNPPNPSGLKTDYLWKRVLTPESTTNIVENYAQIVVEKNKKTGQKTRKQIFPRYHQLDLVRGLLENVRQRGVGRRYLLQHSAGSGKSNSIAWLAHQLIGLRGGSGGVDAPEIFDTVIVITDRRILDQQIDATIRQFMQVGSTVGHAKRSGDLRKFIESGKKIIISTVQKFPFILDEIGDAHRGRKFALIIDEAHSSQGGKIAAAVNEAISDPEDTINDALEKRMAARKMVTNASYFAFTATPKNRTLEMFGDAFPGPEGKTKHRPFHTYTMKQAIDEGFIIDILKYYTPVASYYRLEAVVEDDPMFDRKRAQKKLRKYVERHDHAIRLKAEIMVDHFLAYVLAPRKIGGEARAMVICGGIPEAVKYYRSIKNYLEEIKSPHKVIVAFSGETEVEGLMMTESQLNGFPSDEIPGKIQEHPYRFLVCADKFQTGYDEPLLHTMYVDKKLSGVQAVQTLSRLNRAHPNKRSAFVLDFHNNADTVTEAFSDYYRTTLLSEETDQNKLHDLQRELEDAQVFTQEQVDTLVERYLAGERRDTLDPLLDLCVAVYETTLDEDGQVEFKGNAKAFVRTYDFLASILPYSNPSWEKLSIFLTMLVRKLPAPTEEDLSKGILDAINMDSYRVEKQERLKIMLGDEDAEINPTPTGGGGHKPQPELVRLSEILQTFNEQFGTLFTDADRIFRRIKDDVAPAVEKDEAYRNAKTNTPGKARLELTAAVKKAMGPMLRDDTEFYKQFVQNDSFKRFVTDYVAELISE